MQKFQAEKKNKQNTLILVSVVHSFLSLSLRDETLGTDKRKIKKPPKVRI